MTDAVSPVGDDRVRELESKLEVLAAEVAWLRAGSTPRSSVEGLPDRGVAVREAGGNVDERRVTRRGLIAGVAGVAAVGAAGLVGSASPVAAANGTAVILGSSTQTSTAVTGVSVMGTSAGIGLAFTDNGYSQSVTPKNPAMFAHAAGQNFQTGLLVIGQGNAAGIKIETQSGSGLESRSSTGGGLYGQSNGTGTGVSGNSVGGPGVSGSSEKSYGVLAQSVEFDGVSGSSFFQSGVSGSGRIGVTGTSGVRPTVKTIGVHAILTNASDQVAGQGSAAVLGETVDPGDTPAVVGQVHHVANSGTGIHGTTAGLGNAGRFTITNASSTAAGVSASTLGKGDAIVGEVTNATSGANAVRAKMAGTGVAGRFEVTNVANTTAALYGVTAGTGQGVKGNSTGPAGVGVTGTSTNGLGGQFGGKRAALNLIPTTTAGRPTTGAHSRGDVVVDSAGALFLCTTSGTPGTWVKVTVAPA